MSRLLLHLPATAFAFGPRAYCSKRVVRPKCARVARAWAAIVTSTTSSHAPYLVSSSPEFAGRHRCCQCPLPLLRLCRCNLVPPIGFWAWGTLESLIAQSLRGRHCLSCNPAVGGLYHHFLTRSNRRQAFVLQISTAVLATEGARLRFKLCDLRERGAAQASTRALGSVHSRRRPWASKTAISTAKKSKAVAAELPACPQLLLCRPRIQLQQGQAHLAVPAASSAAAQLYMRATASFPLLRSGGARISLCRQLSARAPAILRRRVRNTTFPRAQACHLPCAAWPHPPLLLVCRLPPARLPLPPPPALPQGSSALTGKLNPVGPVRSWL
ncbi:hypothetical protein QBC34DRAFT_138087 [Podospora aff. communis PSN243]|uniref:Uncharacterized protein n=1 Tax=Podospora aff. communis PSN243 TaxID=3040156 RepID=A0AAV9H364_9PEZI|nr:hypothetical protein QBC34DRAFT_138087 [Podospora aff. communis PSN243]